MNYRDNVPKIKYIQEIEKRHLPTTLGFKFYRYIWLHSRKNLRLRRWAKNKCFKEIYGG